MPRTFVVRINLDRLRANLSRQEGREIDIAEVLQWLRDARFSPLEDDWWMVLEPDLGQLDSEEVTEARVLGEPNDGADPPADSDSPTAVPEC